MERSAEWRVARWCDGAVPAPALHVACALGAAQALSWRGSEEGRGRRGREQAQAAARAVRVMEMEFGYERA